MRRNEFFLEETLNELESVIHIKEYLASTLRPLTLKPSSLFRHCSSSFLLSKALQILNGRIDESVLFV